MNKQKLIIYFLILCVGIGIGYFCYNYQLSELKQFVPHTSPTSSVPNKTTSTISTQTVCPNIYRAIAGLTVNLTDESGNFITGATITSNGHKGKFNEEINYQPGVYSGIYKEDGQYNFTIKKDGYQDYTGSVKLTHDECYVIRQTKNISLKRVAKLNEFTYVKSNQDATKYCNGAKMNSADYRKTINIVEISNTTQPIATMDAMVKAVIDKGTTSMCHTVMKKLSPVVSDFIVTIPPISGFASKTLVMCSCVPEVEVNLLRLDWIKEVVWQ